MSLRRRTDELEFPFVFEDTISVEVPAGGMAWYQDSSTIIDEFFENVDQKPAWFTDRTRDPDVISVRLGSPSDPVTAVPYQDRDDAGDDDFIETVLNQ